MKSLVLRFLVSFALFFGALPASATNICNTPVTTAVSGSIGTVWPGFSNPTSLSIQGVFTYGSGGTSVDVYIQTSIDGSKWIDIANFHWTTASAWVGVNVSASAITTPVVLNDGGLTANTIQAGFLANQYRCKITTVGTYAGATAIIVDVYARQ